MPPSSNRARTGPHEDEIIDLFSRAVHDPNLRSDPRLHLWVVAHAYPTIRAFAQHGNEAHRLYLTQVRLLCPYLGPYLGPSLGPYLCP